MVFLYAICKGEAVEPSTDNGLHGQPLRVLHTSGFTALVGDWAPFTGSEEELWQHEDAVERLMRSHDLLPARFGTMLSSDAAVRELLAGRREELSAALSRVAGACELSVRAIWCETAPTGPTRSGADYLHARAATERRVQELAQTLEERLASVSRAWRLRTSVTPYIPVAGAYLVAREQMRSFMAALGRLDRETTDATFTCTGPWPPYSFTPTEAPGT